MAVKSTRIVLKSQTYKTSKTLQETCYKRLILGNVSSQLKIHPGWKVMASCCREETYYNKESSQ